MWELMLEIDYSSLRNAFWAAYLLTLMLSAVYCLIEKDKAVLFSKNRFDVLQSTKLTATNLSIPINLNGIHAFLYFIRRKMAASPKDSDAPSPLSNT